MSDVSDNLSHRNFSARLTVETFFRTCSAQMCGERGFTRATGESEYPRQDSNLRGTFPSVVFWSVSQTRYCVSPLFYKVSTKNSESNTNHLHTFCTHVFKQRHQLSSNRRSRFVAEERRLLAGMSNKRRK